jgi:DNA-binding GntR family transcriptional regulator
MPTTSNCPASTEAMVSTGAKCWEPRSVPSRVLGRFLRAAVRARLPSAARGEDGESGEIVSAVALAAHLDCSRTFIQRLEAAGAIDRLPGGGYNLDACRTNYIRHLRRERTQSPKNAAEQAFLREKTKALEIRNAQRLGELFPREAALAVIDDFVAAATTELLSLARVARTDLHLRRRIDAAVFEVRQSPTVSRRRRGKSCRKALMAGRIYVASVLFPTDYLRSPRTPQGTEKRPLHHFTPAPRGGALEVSFFYSREAAETLEPKFLKLCRPLIRTTLDNGESVSIVVHQTEFDKRFLPSPEKVKNLSGAVHVEIPAGTEMSDLTAAVWNSPVEDGTGTLIIAEIGGVTLRRAAER